MKRATAAGGVRRGPRPGAAAKRRRQFGGGDDGGAAASGEEDEYVPPEISRKILESARIQAREIEAEDAIENESSSLDGSSTAIPQSLMKSVPVGFDADFELSDDDDDDGAGHQHRSGEYYDQEEEVEEMTMEDEATLRAFMLGGGFPQQRRTIADLIMDKLREHDERAAAGGGDAGNNSVGEGVRIDPKIIECYKNVGRMLASYRSGKLPKAFKIIPVLNNWEEVLYYTEPDLWSPNALRQATRLFASNLNPKMAQRFYNLVLLPRVRAEIDEKKKLHWSIYQALRKSCYKPAAFYKGIVLPLCEAGDCTLREATIVSSVIRQVSLPVLHSSVALLKIAEMRYSGANSIFMRTLIEKKYALPFRVVDGVVKHFASFQKERRTLPVLWHRCLLAFAQRYKTDLTPEHLEDLRALMKAQAHDLITPETRNQLFGNAAGEIHRARREAAMQLDGDDGDDLVME